MDRGKFFVWCAVSRHLAKNSLKHTRIRYDYLFRWLCSKKLNSGTTEEFILHLRDKGLRNVSINSYIRVINLIDIFERENGKDYNLLKKVNYFEKEKRTPCILTLNEIKRILTVVIKFINRGSFDCFENYNLALWVIASTGCRLEEGLNLKKCDIFLGNDRGYCIFKNTKTYNDRKTPLPPILIPRLKEHLATKKAEDLAFTTSLGHKIPAQIMESYWKKCCEKIGLTKRPRIHDLRASYIMEHYRNGTKFTDIQNLVGHVRADTTLGYMKFEEEALFEAAQNHGFFSTAITAQWLAKRVRGFVENIRIESTNIECLNLRKEIEILLAKYV